MLKKGNFRIKTVIVAEINDKEVRAPGQTDDEILVVPTASLRVTNSQVMMI